MKTEIKQGIAAVALIGLLVAGSENAFAGSPLITDDAGTVDVGNVEVELSGSYTHDSESVNGIISRTSTTDMGLKVTTGLYKNLGVSLSVPYTISQRSYEDGQLTGKTDGFGDMTMEVKYAFIELGGVSLAIKPAITMPTGKYSAGLSDGRWQFGTTLIATKEFQDGKYALHANLGYQHLDYRTEEARQSNRNDLVSGSIAGEMKVLDKLTAVIDFGLSTPQDRSTDIVPAYSLVGARYEVTKNLDVNAGVKVGLTKSEDDVSAVYGLVLKF